ncbi:hypothetical protein Tco_1515409 [Tanacetum coccineum]
MDDLFMDEFYGYGIWTLPQKPQEQTMHTKERDVKEKRENEKPMNKLEMRRYEKMINAGTTSDANLNFVLKDAAVQGKIRMLKIDR